MTTRSGQTGHAVRRRYNARSPGRGSRTPKWLQELGYERPEESEVKIRVGYATRVYERKPGDLEGAELLMIAPAPPHGKRMGLIFPVEGDRWIVSMGGWARTT